MSEEFEKELKIISEEEQMRNTHLENPYGRAVWMRFIREVVVPKSFDAGYKHVAQKFTMKEWLLHFRD